MNRSIWKGPNVFIDFEIKSHKVIFISRNVKITPMFLGLNFKVYNGKKYINLFVVESMMGHKFGEFVSSRAPFTFKKKN